MKAQTGMAVCGRAWVLAGVVAWVSHASAALEVEQTVNADFLTSAAIVEFVVTVRNNGVDVVSTGLITVEFSAGLAAPGGTAPFFSQGSFDPATGRWTLGDLRPGTSATLSLPAQVTADPLPPCEFSRAHLSASDGTPGWAGALAFAALRLPNVTHCVNLVVEEPTAYRMWCSASITVALSVSNLGPDPAQQVRVTVSQQPDLLPKLEFEYPCSGSGECLLGLLDPGQWTPIWLGTGDLKNNRERSVTLEATASSGGTQLEPAGTSAYWTSSIAPYEKCDFGGGPSAGAGCFIATAAYGSPLHAHVAALRRFRDRYLLTHPPGRALVTTYYRVSPPLAAYIATRPGARALARAILAPLVLAVAHPGWALGIALGSLLAWWQFRRARRTPCVRFPVRPTTECVTSRGKFHEDRTKARGRNGRPGLAVAPAGHGLGRQRGNRTER